MSRWWPGCSDWVCGWYGPWQVQPSGTTPPIVVTVSKGGNLQQDILMQSSAAHPPDWFEPVDYASPAPLPAVGEWLAGLSGYGNVDYFWFSGQNNRTLSVEVTALDEAVLVTVRVTGAEVLPV